MKKFGFTLRCLQISLVLYSIYIAFYIFHVSAPLMIRGLRHVFDGSLAGGIVIAVVGFFSIAMSLLSIYFPVIVLDLLAEGSGEFPKIKVPERSAKIFYYIIELSLLYYVIRFFFVYLGMGRMLYSLSPFVIEIYYQEMVHSLLRYFLPMIFFLLWKLYMDRSLTVKEYYGANAGPINIFIVFFNEFPGELRRIPGEIKRLIDKHILRSGEGKQ